MILQFSSSVKIEDGGEKDMLTNITHVTEPQQA